MNCWIDTVKLLASEVEDCYTINARENAIVTMESLITRYDGDNILELY